MGSYISRFAVALTGLFLVALAPPARAEVWPERTVRILVPLPPGGPTDAAARRLAEKLAERWGRAVIIENKQGADGILAVSALLGARDNHTLLFSFPGIISINPLLHEKLPYDPDRDLVPIAPVLDNFIGFAASASTGAATLSELVSIAQENPGKINWSALPGVPNYVFLALLKNAKLEATRIAYRDFSPAYQDLHEGRLQVVVAGITNLIPHREKGTAKILAVVNRERAAFAPEIPTVAEAGFPELTFDSPVGVLCPARHGAFSRGADFRRRARDYGGAGIPAATDQRRRFATERYAGAVRRSHCRPAREDHRNPSVDRDQGLAARDQPKPVAS